MKLKTKMIKNKTVDVLLNTKDLLIDNIWNIIQAIVLILIFSPVIAYFIDFLSSIFPALSPITINVNKVLLFIPNLIINIGTDPYANCVEDRFGNPICP